MPTNADVRLARCLLIAGIYAQTIVRGLAIKTYLTETNMILSSQVMFKSRVCASAPRPFAQAFEAFRKKLSVSRVTLESWGDSSFNPFPTRLYIQNGSRQG
jgi:hypothetical protein